METNDLEYLENWLKEAQISSTYIKIDNVERRIYNALHNFTKYSNHSSRDKYNRSGIYCICVGDKVLYIGRSKCMYDRVQQHLKAIINDNAEDKYEALWELVYNNYTITFDVVEYAEVADLAEREAYWINYYLPPLNTQIPKHKAFQKQKNRLDQYFESKYTKQQLEEGVEYEMEWYQLALSLAPTRNIVEEKGVIF